MTATRIECLAAAAALEGALHLLDDDESAQTLARLADQWRAQAASAPLSREEQAFLAGFRISGEGWNGEYPHEGIADAAVWDAISTSYSEWVDSQPPLSAPKPEEGTDA